jgi:hypothetical protein
MANPLQWRHTATGANLYFTIRNLAGSIWNTYATPAFETLVTSHWYAAASNNYAVAMTESPAGSYLYAGTFPAIAGNMTAGWYWVDVFAQAGASPAISDTMVATLLGWWDGTTFKPNADDTVALGGTVQTAGRDLGVVLPATALNNAPAITDYQQRSVAVTLPATAPVNWLNATAFAAGVLPARFASLAIDTAGNVIFGNAGVATADAQATLLSAINAITVNTARSGPVMPGPWVRPATGMVVQTITLRTWNLQGVPEGADNDLVTIHMHAGGVSFDGQLASTTMTKRPGTVNIYDATYTLAGADQATPQPLNIALLADFAWSVGGTAMDDGAGVMVIDEATQASLQTLQDAASAIKGQTDKIGTNAADSPNAQTAQAAVGSGTPGTLGGLATCSLTNTAGNPAVAAVVPSGDCLDLAAALVVSFEQVTAGWSGDFYGGAENNSESVTLYKSPNAEYFSSLWQAPRFTPPSGQNMPPPLPPQGHYDLFWSRTDGAWMFRYSMDLLVDQQAYYLGSTDPANPAGTYIKQGIFGHDFTPPLVFPQITITAPTTITFTGAYSVGAVANNLPASYLTPTQQSQLATAAGAQQAGAAVTLPPDVAQASDLAATVTTIADVVGSVPAGVAAMLRTVGLAEYVSDASGSLRWTQPAMFFAGLTVMQASQLGAAAAALATAGPIQVVSPVAERANGEGPFVLRFFRGDTLSANTGRQITLTVGDSWAQYLAAGSGVHLTIWRNSAGAPGPQILTVAGAVSAGPPQTITFTATHAQTMNLTPGRYSADLQVHLPGDEWFTVRSGIVDVSYAQFPDET